MKFLICLAGEGPFEGLVRFGGRISQAFGADLSVVFVERNIRSSHREEVLLAQDKMSEWNIAHPGLRALTEAQGFLFDQGVIESDEAGSPNLRHPIKPGVFGAYETHLYGQGGANIRFRLRLGNQLEQIKDEVERGSYDLVIVDCNNDYGLTKNLIHFVNSSLLAVKNLREIDYRLLICIHPNQPHHRTELVGAKLAKFFNTQAVVLSVLKSDRRPVRTTETLERVEKLLRKAHIPYEVRTKTGRVANEITAVAGDEFVIVVGATDRSILAEFVRGSVPLSVIKQARCPVLVVR